MDFSSSSMEGVCCISSSFFLGDCPHRAKYLGVETEACITCCKNCARTRRTRYVPQDLLLGILLRLPARVLHDVMRHVCGEWNLMISNPNFIHHHVRNSTRGILIQVRNLPGNAIYVEMRRGSLEICKFDYRFERLVWTSCNGLVLNTCSKDLYVINPLTNQRTFIPQYFDQRRHLAYFHLAFVEASMEYKVVHVILDETLGDNVRLQIEVLTVGVDKVWRHIDTEHSPLLAMETLIKSPLVTGAYIHWIASSFVLTLNVETETICGFPLPPIGNRWRRFLPMGNYLSIICESNKFFRDVWEMNPETGQWTMLLSFDSESLVYRYKDFSEFPDSIVPYGWLADREVLFFSTSYFQRDCVAYNIKTREMQSLELTGQSHIFRAHVNSLLQVNNLQLGYYFLEVGKKTMALICRLNSLGCWYHNAAFSYQYFWVSL